MPDVPDDYQIQVPIDVAETTQNGVAIPSYRDTLFVAASEFQAMSWDDVQGLKDERYNNWLANFLTPPTQDDALQQAYNALTQAQQAVAQSIDAVNAVQAAQAAVGIPGDS